jgi:acyl-CoA dehydrogenase
MTTRAEKRGDDWILNGRKIWISKAAEADFTILMAVTDKSKGARGGISAFLIDKGTPGYKILRKIQMLAGMFTYEVALEDCRLGWVATARQGRRRVRDRCRCACRRAVWRWLATASAWRSARST